MLAEIVLPQRFPPVERFAAAIARVLQVALVNDRYVLPQLPLLGVFFRTPLARKHGPIFFVNLLVLGQVRRVDKRPARLALDLFRWGRLVLGFRFIFFACCCGVAFLRLWRRLYFFFYDSLF